MNEEYKEEIKDIKKLLVEDNLTYSGQLRFLAYTVKLEEENQQLKHILDELEKWAEEYEEKSYGLGEYSTGINDCLRDILNKLKELRGRE